MIYAVGLIGTIASGKSTVAHLFKELGAHFLSADQIAKTLTHPSHAAYQKIVDHFGNNFLMADKTLNRSRLRQHIFDHPEDKKWLESLLHPLIRQQLAKEILNFNNGYVIVEIPLLSDRKAYPFLQRILLVTAPKKTQIKRLCQRDHLLVPQAQLILSTQQKNLGDLKRWADDIIENHQSENDLLIKVSRLHQKYTELSRA